MAGNLSDHYRVFDTGNNLDVATAFSAILVCSKDGYWPILLKNSKFECRFPIFKSLKFTPGE